MRHSPPYVVFFSLLFVLFIKPVAALEVPKLTGPVVDLSGILSQAQQNKMGTSLVRFQQHFGPQIQLLIIPKLIDETIETFSIKVVDQWQLGSKEKDDGVLLLVATQDRKIRIEVGQGLEGDLPDALAGRIIQQGIVPFFKQNQMGNGIISGLNLIAQSLGGNLEDIPAPKLKKAKKKSSNIAFILFIIFFIIGPKLLGSRRRRGIGGSMLGGAILGSGLSGRSHSSGGFGGGFSGGGGGFSGGGASGGW